MELYRKIYDPDGIAYEVTPERASNLVLNEGWSNLPKANKTANKKIKKIKAADELAADTEEVTEDESVLLSSE